MKWSREEYIAHMNFENIGREMFCELFGPLVGLEQEWAAQGASLQEQDLSAFGWDYVPYQHLKANCHAVTGLDEIVLEDTKEHIIQRDYMGRTTRLCKGSATIALPLDYPVRTYDDWLKIKHWYEFSESRIDYDQLRDAARRKEKGELILADIPGGFDEPRQLMGEEELCIAFYEQSELIEDMLNTMGNTCLKVFERVIEIVKPDCLCVHEDMAGKSGPLAGPEHVLKFIKPYYQKVWKFLAAEGCSIFSQDSDGNMNAVIDSFIDCGVNCFYPLEPAAGMDIVALRKKYGKAIALKGGIDKLVLRGTKEDILRELEYKMDSSMRGGGTVFAIDHRIPNGVPIENYRYYVKTGREILGLPPIKAEAHVRMAF